MQRVQSDLRLNPHLHTIALDGVFAPAADGTLVFHAVSDMDSMDVADLLQVVRVRVLRFLERRGVIENADELIVLPDELAEREPALAQLAAASVHGLPPAGPERRDRPLPPVALGGQLGVEITARLAASELGFSLHAGTTAAGDDSAGREALVRYALRPPIAQERLKLLDDGLVRIELRRPFKDGTVAVDLDPLSLLVRLAASIPPRRFNVVRYQGVLGAAEGVTLCFLSSSARNLERC